MSSLFGFFILLYVDLCMPLRRVVNKSDQLKHKYPDDNIIYKCKCIQVDKIKYNIK
jgi:hypothetical protein